MRNVHWSELKSVRVRWQFSSHYEVIPSNFENKWLLHVLVDFMCIMIKNRLIYMAFNYAVNSQRGGTRQWVKEVRFLNNKAFIFNDADTIKTKRDRALKGKQGAETWMVGVL